MRTVTMMMTMTILAMGNRDPNSKRHGKNFDFVYDAIFKKEKKLKDTKKKNL